MDHQVLEQQNESALGCADRDQEIDHADDFVGISHHEDSPARRLLQDQPKAAQLLLPVGREVLLLGEEIHQELG